MSGYIPRGLSTGSGRRPGPDAQKDCVGCGVTIFRIAGRPRPLDTRAWEVRRFCSDDCRRDHQARHGRVAAIGGKRLSREEHFAFWRERLSWDEIREIGPYIDFLDTERDVAA